MRAATGADCRRRRAADLLFPLTFEALDNRAALPFPKILKPVKDGRIRWRGRFFFCPQLQAGFRCRLGKITTALATDRAFGRRILRLLEAAVRAFHTDLGRRRICHWVRILRRGRFFFCLQLQAGFRCRLGKITTALATDGAFGRRILRLLEAAVRAFHTDLGRRRICHWVLSQNPFLIRALQRPP